jgi:hypothetical protein
MKETSAEPMRSPVSRPTTNIPVCGEFAAAARFESPEAVSYSGTSQNLDSHPIYSL